MGDPLMNMTKTLITGIAVCSFLLAGSALANEEKSVVMKIKSDVTGVISADLSDLEVGDAKTIVTDDGKTVDLLRTKDGFEVYIDGELIEMPHMTVDHSDGLHKRTIRVECTDDTECEEHHNLMFISESELSDVESVGEIHKIVEIHGGDLESIDIEQLHEIEEDGELIWISEDEDVTIDGDVETKVIVLKREKIADEI
jgi:hypothetical protein